jgi:hypothetical protein
MTLRAEFPVQTTRTRMGGVESPLLGVTVSPPSPPRSEAELRRRHPPEDAPLRHGLRSSISPEARNTTSSAMFVTRSPIRSM